MGTGPVTLVSPGLRDSCLSDAAWCGQNLSSDQTTPPLLFTPVHLLNFVSNVSAIVRADSEPKAGNAFHRVGSYLE